MTDAPDPVNSIVMAAVMGQHAGMKPVVALLNATMLLAACTGPLAIYYRPGISVARMQTDQTRCEVAALRDAPVANQIRQRPPIYFPGRQICGAGGCYFSEGGWIEGSIYTVDVNEDLRGRVEAQCMAQKGYQPVSVPLCSGPIRSAVQPAQTLTLPRLTENACSIRYDDGSWQIVNPIISQAAQ